MLNDESIVAIASEGSNAESLDQTEEIVNAGNMSGMRNLRVRTGNMASGYQYRSRKIVAGTDGIYVAVSLRF